MAETDSSLFGQLKQKRINKMALLYPDTDCVFIEADKLFDIAKVFGCLEAYKFYEISELKALVENIFSEHNFSTEFDDAFNLTGLTWGVKNQEWDEDDYNLVEFLDSIAPFVKKGSYLQFDLAANGKFRYVFNGKEVVASWPTIVWDDPNTL